MALAMENADAYEQILGQYAQTLADFGEPMENKVQELLVDLATKAGGGNSATDGNSTRTTKILDRDPMDLLKTILPVLAQNRGFQRLLQPYHALTGKGRGGGGGGGSLLKTLL